MHFNQFHEFLKPYLGYIYVYVYISKQGKFCFKLYFHGDAKNKCNEQYKGSISKMLYLISMLTY